MRIEETETIRVNTIITIETIMGLPMPSNDLLLASSS